MARSGFPSMTALLGLLAVAGYQNRDKISEMLNNRGGGMGGQGGLGGRQQQQGGLGGMLGGMMGGQGAQMGGGMGGLGGLLAGLGGGGVGELLDLGEEHGVLHHEVDVEGPVGGAAHLRHEVGEEEEGGGGQAGVQNSGQCQVPTGGEERDGRNEQATAENR